MKTIAGVFLLLMLAHAPRCAAQFFSSDDKVKDEIFLHEVKNIDEFIERFNDEKSSFIRKEYKEANKPYNFSRKEIIMCLFNLCLLYTSPSPRDGLLSRMPSSA